MTGMMGGTIQDAFIAEHALNRAQGDTTFDPPQRTERATLGNFERLIALQPLSTDDKDWLRRRPRL